MIRANQTFRDRNRSKPLTLATITDTQKTLVCSDCGEIPSVCAGCGGELIESDADAARIEIDIKKAGATLSEKEARYLVDSYYQRQKDRIETGNQIRSVSGMSPEAVTRNGWHTPEACRYANCHRDDGKYSVTEEPHDFYLWLWARERSTETSIASALSNYSESRELGRWARSITGIGPIIAAGLLSHIDIKKAHTAGQIWRFAGLDPTVKWEKGQKRPWNTPLKTLCWKIGDSFVKTKGREGGFYGKLYEHRREKEDTNNDALKFADQAEAILSAKKIGKDTEAYKAYSQGMLPKAQIFLRSKRWAVKLFLAHYQHVGYEIEYGTEPPKPYVISVLGHQGLIKPPNWPME